MKRIAALSLIGSLSVFACAQPTDEADASSEAANLSEGEGLTAGERRKISDRTIEIDISTPLITARAVNGPHRLRVTLPADYEQRPNVRFPVIYLLHGGAGGNSAQWTTAGGAAEFITQGKPVIVVSPDGGKVGWYTNWVDEKQGSQKWADFYLNHLIPWVDANFRTVAAKDGRAIAGLSMGGYGAVRLAQDRPDLFASVASFSGAVDLGDSGTKTVITQQAIQNGFSRNGPFGSPAFPEDPTWKKQDPMRRAERLAGIQVLLYAGSGTNDGDAVERTMGASAHRFSGKLTAAGVKHDWWMYGRPGPSSPFGCDGGHNFSCWNFAFNDALPKILGVLKTPAPTP